MFKVSRHFLNFSILSKIIVDIDLKKNYKTRTCSEYHPGLMDASLLTVPNLYQFNGKTVPPGESQVMNEKNEKDWGYV